MASSDLRPSSEITRQVQVEKLIEIKYAKSFLGICAVVYAKLRNTCMYYDDQNADKA